jgi:predicted nucleic acid-binding protein
VIVADASAALEVVLVQPAAPSVRRALARGRLLHVPEHFHVEALSAIRRLALRGSLTEREADLARWRLGRVRVTSHRILGIEAAIWALRQRLTAYDAAYLALAQRLDAPLVTLDAGLAAAARDEGRLVALT